MYSVNFFCGSGCAGFVVVCRGGVGCGWGVGLGGCHWLVSVAGGGGSEGEAEGPEPVVVGALGVAVVVSWPSHNCSAMAVALVDGVYSPSTLTP